MSQLTTLLLAAVCPKLTVLTPQGTGRLTNLRLTGAPLATVSFEDGTKSSVAPALVRPVLKGFTLFRADIMQAESRLSEQLMSRLTPTVAPHTLLGFFGLPINYDMTRPALETPIDFPGNEAVEAGNFGRLRITEDLRLFWQPTNSFNTSATGPNALFHYKPGDKLKSRLEVQQGELGWLPLHLTGWRDWLLNQGYAAELPAAEYVTPGVAQILNADATARRAYFYGTNQN